VRPRVLLRNLGQLLGVLAALTLVPLLAALATGHTPVGLRYLVVATALAAFGVTLGRLRAPAEVQPNEGMVLVAGVFLLSPLLMAWPMMASGMTYLDALFEAISGVTTTGLSTRPSLDGAPDAFLFARAWTQWYGGLGIVVFSLALVVQPGLVARGLAATETQTGDLVGGTRAYARWVLGVYGGLTAAGLAGAVATGLGPGDAVLYVLPAVSTGGFAPVDGSLAPLGLPAQSWLLALCLAGALPLTLVHGLWHRRRPASLDLLQAGALLGAVVVGTLLVGLTLRVVDGLPWERVAHHAPVLAASSQTTAGFSTLPVSGLSDVSKLLLVVAMSVGGGVGSTAGGIKLLRVIIVARVCSAMIARTGLSRHAVAKPRLKGQRLHEEEIQAAFALLVIFVVVVLASWVPFVAVGYDPVDSLFEVVSATGTVGLSAGVTSASLPPVLKVILCADMLLGRLEVLAWLVVLAPGTWMGRRREAA
jgi:trk system potassium uptake protein TrkH